MADILKMLGDSAGTILKTGLGAGQLIGGALMKKKRPEYQIPESLVKNVEMAKLLSMTNKRAGRDVADAEIDESVANAIASQKRVANSSTNLQSSVQNALNAQLGAKRKQDQMDSQDKLSRIQLLLSQQGKLAQEQKNKQDWDQLQPYRDFQKTKSALMGSGIRNLYGGAQEFGSLMRAK